MNRFWEKIMGIFCIIIGIVGLILPLLSGIPFLLLGLYFLDHSSKEVKSGVLVNTPN